MSAKESFEKDPLTGSRQKTVSVQMFPETIEVIDQLAHSERRTRSNMAGLLIQLGLVAHLSGRER